MDKLVVNGMIVGKDQCTPVSRSLGQRERGRANIHLPIANKNISVGAEAAKALVLMDILVIGIEEAAVAKHEVENGIDVAVGVLRIPKCKRRPATRTWLPNR